MGFRHLEATAANEIFRCLACLQSLTVGRAYKVLGLGRLELVPGATALAVA